MTFRQFAFRNVVRNKRTYVAFFMSSAFSVMIFFVYAAFIFHPAIQSTELHRNAKLAMTVAEYIVYIFSVFFVFYSVSAFLKSRKREFGVLVMHGMTYGQLRRMVFIGNMVIGVTSIAAGLAVGLLFSKLFMLVGTNMMRMEPLPFYLPVKALALTCAAFVLLFLAISMSTAVFVRASRPIDLLKGGSKPKTEPKASIALSLIAALLLLAGYAISFAAKGPLVVVALVPVTIMVIIGSYFLYTQLSVFVIRALRRNRLLFLRKTNILLFSDLAYRMKDNARMFFLVTIVTTVAICALGTFAGFQEAFRGMISDQYPFAYNYTSMGENAGHENQQSVQGNRESAQGNGEDIREEQQTVGESQPDIRGNQQSVQGNREDIREKQQEIMERELGNRNVQFAKFSARLSDVEWPDGRMLTMVRLSEYNRMAQALEYPALSLGEGEAAAIWTRPNQPLPQKDWTLRGSNLTFEVQEVVGRPLFPPVIGEPIFIVPDDALEMLNPAKVDLYVAYQTSDSSSTAETGRAIAERLKSAGGSDGWFFASPALLIDQTRQNYNLMLFAGLFVSCVFFVASGSFLYFRLFTDLHDDKEKYRAIAKIGLTDRELAKVATSQLALLFFVPFLIALLHSAVALFALHNLIYASVLRSAMTVCGIFAAGQFLYFLLLRSRYLKHLKRAAV